MPAQKILIVEDDASIKHLINFKLKSVGYDTYSCSNGAEALELLQSTKVDLILLDMMMPVMTGKEFLIAMKGNKELKSIPVIFLTARTLEKEVIEGLSLGADDYIKKPFSPQELIARIKTTLARKN